MKITPDMGQTLQQFAFAMRQMAEEAGTDCDAPGCNALTLGVRCANCSRRLCVGHTYWNTSGAQMTALCPYCVLAENSSLFDEED